MIEIDLMEFGIRTELFQNGFGISQQFTGSG